MTATDLLNQLDRLASFEPGPFPVLSLYLNMQPDQHGRDQFEPFLRKELADRINTYSAGSPERDSLDRDARRIREYLDGVEPSANGLALFSSSGAELFETITLAAPIEAHRLFISSQPHLYPLAHLIDQYPRYAVLVADTRQARLFVIAANAIERTAEVEGTKTRRHKMGGWSQARYQRHIENYHQQHAKEVIDALDRLVKAEGIQSIVLAGDEVILPLLRDQFSKELNDRVVEVVKADIRTPEHEILEMTADVMSRTDAENDRERVEAMLDAYRGNGLATAGLDNTRLALEMGQVDELMIAGTPDAIGSGKKPDASTGNGQGERSPQEQTADELIVKARQTGARVTFIEDASLLAPVGGVGALLRFKV